MANTHNYSVALAHFEGPLELLILLIERQELEVTELTISQVTHDYLAYISALQTTHTEDLRWFLDIGSRLVAYKARAIYKDTLIAPENIDELADITHKLERYQAWRQIARQLSKLFDSPMQLRPAPSNTAPSAPKNLTITKLASVWRNISTQKSNIQPASHRVLISRTDLQNTMHQLLDRLSDKKQLSSALEVSDRRSRTLSLLAILELIKQDLIELVFEYEEAYVRTV